MGKPFCRLVSLNFSPNMPDFDCKICLTSRKNGNSPHSKPSTATSLIFIHKKITTIMNPGVVVFAVPIAAFLMVVAIRYLQSKENMAMIERGLNPAEHKRTNQANPSQTLKNGLLFVGAGFGLLLAIIITNMFQLQGDSSTGIFFALIAIFGGAGLLGAYLYERKNPPSSQE